MKIPYVKYLKTIIAIIAGVLVAIIVDILAFKGMTASLYILQIVLGTYAASLIGRDYPVIQGVFIALITCFLSYSVSSDYYASHLSASKIVFDTFLNVLFGVVTGLILKLAYRSEKKAEKKEYPRAVKIFAYITAALVIQFVFALLFLSDVGYVLDVSLVLFAVGIFLLPINALIVFVCSIISKRKTPNGNSNNIPS